MYAKTSTHTNTDSTLATYHYSISGYRTSNDRVNDLHNTGGVQPGRSRSHVDLATSQDLGGPDRECGSVYLSVSQ